MTQLSTAGDAGTPATDRPNPGAEIAREIATFLLVIQLNPKAAQPYMAQGLRLETQSLQKSKEVIERHAQEAEAIGRDAFRADRENKVGQRVADSGVPLFGWHKNGRQLVFLNHAVQDVLAQGYRIMSMNLRKRDTDEMFQLFIKFEKLAEGKTEFVVGPGLRVVLDRSLASVYEHCHGYRNPNGSIVINVSHRIDAHTVPSTAIRDLRVRPDGRINTALRSR